MAFAQSSNFRSPTADGDRAPPRDGERLFRDDLPRVRDEPEQGCGLWIGITVCKAGAGNSLDDTGRVPREAGNSTGGPGNTPEAMGNVPRGISHSRGALRSVPSPTW